MALDGGFRGLGTFDPDSHGETQHSTLSLRGTAGPFAVDAVGTAETRDGRTLIHDARVVTDSGALRLVSGDDVVSLAGFRNETEVRRGLSAGVRIGAFDLDAHGSPSANAGDVPGSGPVRRSVFGGGAGFRLAPVRVHAGGWDLSKEDGAPGTRLGLVEAEVALPFGNRLSGAAARGRFTATASGLPALPDRSAWRGELRTEAGWLRSLARWERRDPGFRSFGDPARYGGPTLVEVAPALTLLREAEPHGRLFEARGESVREAGLRGRPAAGVTLDAVCRRRVLGGRRTEGLEAAGNWQPGAASFVHARAVRDLARGTPIPGTARADTVGSLAWGFPLSGRLAARVSVDAATGSGEAAYGPAGGLGGGALTASGTGRRLAPGAEVIWTSWSGSWDARLLATWERRRGAAGTPVRRILTGLASVGFYWRSFSIAPEARLLGQDLDAPGKRPDWTVALRVSQDFPLHAFARKASITGMVFTDTNGNGRLDAGEPPAAGIPVILDGGARVATDAGGRFSFDGIVPGPHRMSVDPWDWEMPPEFSGSARVARVVRAGLEGALEIPVSRGEAPAAAPVPAAPAAPVTASGFPEGWEVPAEAAGSATVAGESGLARAHFQVGKAENLLGRLKATGYQVLVADDVKAIEALRIEARNALSAGDTAAALRLADEMGARLQKAKARIEAETQQPLRW
jgi:hypothetical protein